MPIFTSKKEEVTEEGKSLLRDYDYLFKLVLVGQSSVGKSSLLMRFCDDTFFPSMTSTLGIDFKIKTIEINDKKVKLNVFDSSGQERFRSITQSFYRGASGILLVFDCTNLESMKDLQYWINESHRYAGEKTPIIILANKSDLPAQISIEEAKIFAKENNCEFFVTSAKTGENVEEAFQALAQSCISTVSKTPIQKTSSENVNLGSKSAANSWCSC